MSSLCSGLFSLYCESGQQGQTFSGFVGPWGGGQAEDEWVGRWVGKGEMQSPYRAGRLHSSRGEPWPHAHAARVASDLEPGTGADPTQGQQRARRQVGFREFAAKRSCVERRLSFGVNTGLEVKTWQL